MTMTKRIPSDLLKSHGVLEGDTLRILSTVGESFVVEIVSPASTPAVACTASEWVRSALGSVHSPPSEKPADPRMEYYAGKYGVPS